jgi:hypothetical protein
MVGALMKYILIILILSTLLGCNDYTSDARYDEPVFTITGLLYEGETITPDNAIFIGRSVDAYNGNLNDVVIDDADVTLYNITRNDSIQLEFIFEIPQTKNELPRIGYYDPTDSFIIYAKETYYLKADIQNEGTIITLEATTTVPDSIVANVVQDTVFTSDPLIDFPHLSFETANQEHPLTIGTYNEDTVKLLFQFYCEEDYENAYYIQDFPGAGDHPDDEDDYEDPIHGFPRKIEYFTEYNPNPTEYDFFLISDNSYKINFFFYGDYKITVNSVDTNYFNFLYMTNNYQHGGIINGFGYFGSVCKDVIYTHIVE